SGKGGALFPGEGAGGAAAEGRGAEPRAPRVPTRAARPARRGGRSRGRPGDRRRGGAGPRRTTRRRRGAGRELRRLPGAGAGRVASHRAVPGRPPARRARGQRSELRARRARSGCAGGDARASLRRRPRRRMTSRSDLLRVTPDDPEYRRLAAAEAEYWSSPVPFALEALEERFSEGPVDRYTNVRFTGDRGVGWHERIARHGPFRRGLVLGLSALRVEGRILETNPGLHLTFLDLSEGSLARRTDVLGARFPGRVATRC